MLSNELYEELRSKLKDPNNRDLLSELFHAEYTGTITRYDSEYTDILGQVGIDSIKYVDSYGGEGQGDNYWSVYIFVHKEQRCYIRFYGYYNSYEGAEYEDMERLNLMK